MEDKKETIDLRKIKIQANKEGAIILQQLIEVGLSGGAFKSLAVLDALRAGINVIDNTNEKDNDNGQ
jgi:hypothetical protein